MDVRNLFQPILENLNSASVDVVYGTPVDRHQKTLIPVAKLAFGFGGGTGTEAGAAPETPREGGGAGGGVAVKPLGVFEVSDRGTRFVSVGQDRRLLSALLLGVFIGLSLKRGRRNRQIST